MSRQNRTPKSPPPVYGYDPEKEAMIDRLIEIYQPYSPTPLTRADGREIARNLIGAYSVLLEWKRKELQEQRQGGTSGEE